MKRFTLVLAVTAFIASCGRQTESSDLAGAVDAAASGNEVVVQRYSAKPTNGGINPAYGAIDVAVTFVAGSNHCMAVNQNLSIVQVAKGKEVHIVVKANPNKNVACTAGYNPETQTLHTTVFVKMSAPVRIYVDNVGKFGNSVNIGK